MLPLLAYQSGSTDHSLSEQNQRMSCRTEVRSPDLDFTTVKLVVGFTTKRSHLSQVTSVCSSRAGTAPSSSSFLGIELPCTMHASAYWRWVSVLNEWHCMNTLLGTHYLELTFSPPEWGHQASPYLNYVRMIIVKYVPGTVLSPFLRF